MPRPIWSGAISFGLVSIPVKLFTATESKTVHFHQLEAGTGERIERKRVAADSGEEVAYDDIVKGYDLGDGRHVIVEPDELDAVDPGQKERIEIEDFVALDDVDPIFFQKSYYIAPADEGAAKSYELLRAAMQDANRVAIARFVMRTKQYLAAIRSASGILLLQTMFFSDEIRDPQGIDEIKLLDDDLEPDDRELATAAQLVDSLTSDWDPEAYDDTYRQQVVELIERKAEGDEMVVDDDRDADSADVIDLMAALEASVERVRGERTGSSRAGAGDPLADLTRNELYERAQAHDIPGRSTMTKDELVAAIERAS
ncbi:non-homologous end joining protein Ku [Ilumatobacter nonamiensis]|uniref:non-homologous end joining protein Ku n=1 Tax=Ilumatobacter nonamiensis TaxID=467093 RepID=UPI00034CDE1E|nr:Ku protein [Ilumatobacter nonamiensis]